MRHIKNPRKNFESLLSADETYLEIDPLNRGLAKKDRYKTTIVDRLDTAALCSKFSYLDNLEKGIIEPVDHVWIDGPLHDLTVGPYDGIIASHVIEHMQDPLEFLVSCSRLLCDNGRVLLFIPDKRATFDYFRSVTMTGDILGKHLYPMQNAANAAQCFNNIAYCIRRGRRVSWNLAPFIESRFIADLEAAALHLKSFNMPNYKEIGDYHLSCFVPSSFELIIFELGQLGLINLTAEVITKSKGGEFFAILRRNTPKLLPPTEQASVRKKILYTMLQELRFQGEIAWVGHLITLVWKWIPPSFKRRSAE